MYNVISKPVKKPTSRRKSFIVGLIPGGRDIMGVLKDILTGGRGGRPKSLPYRANNNIRHLIS